MPGSSNFLQHNPTEANQESDGTYSIEVLRTGGIPVDAILPSAWLNKIWYQCTTMVAALAQMMAAKGFVISDANLNTLAGVLSNILTWADFPHRLVNIIQQVDLVGFSGTVIDYLTTPAVVGFYRVSIQAFIHSPTGTSTLSVGINWTQNGQGFSGIALSPTSVSGSLPGVGEAQYCLYCDAGIPIQYVASWTSGGSGDSYDLHMRLEAL
jgi:hypothetical protein